MASAEFEHLDNAELLRLWARVSSELRERNLTRSGNVPTGDYCEVLVAEHFKVKPVGGSTKGYDVLLADGTRIQVKGRRQTAHARVHHFGVIRDLNDPEAVRRHARWIKRLNGWRLPVIRGAMLDDPGIERLNL